MSLDEEVRHWKDRANDLEDALREAESSLQDFMESSKALEAEMEKEIAASNQAQLELQTRNERLKSEIETWKNKFQNAITESSRDLGQMRKELQETTESHNKYKTKLRDMELDNDELENAERMITESLADMESRYNRALEKTALLEEELVAKDQLREENQRLKDEIREMNEELSVLRESRMTPATSPRPPSSRDELRLEDLAIDSKRNMARKHASIDGRISRESGRSESLFPPVARRRGTLDSSVRLGQRANDSPTPANGKVYTNTASTRTKAPTVLSTPRQSIQPRTPRPVPPPMASSRKIFQEMYTKMQSLESRISSARTPSVSTERSAIPRPSSRLGASQGLNESPHSFRPRASIDANSTLSSIPVPRNSLSKSTSRRTGPGQGAFGDAEPMFDSPIASRSLQRPSSRISIGLGSRVQSPLGTNASEDWKSTRLRRESQLARERAGTEARQSAMRRSEAAGRR